MQYGAADVRWRGGNAFMETVYYLVATISLIFTAYFKLRSRIAKIEKAQNTTWKGIVGRGWAEAQQKRHLMDVGGKTECSRAAREAYAPITLELKELHKEVMARIKRRPSAEEMAWEIEQRFQDFMVNHVCPVLGVNQFGCVAIAYVIATE